MRDLVYLSYSSTEQALLRELREALLRDVRLRDRVWDDSRVPDGADLDATFAAHVARARIMIMLVGDRYVNRAECRAWRIEIPEALAAQERGELTIMWLAATEMVSDLAETPFAGRKAAYPIDPPLAAMTPEQRAEAFDTVRLKVVETLGLVQADARDVFLCHNSKDKPIVRDIAKRLGQHGVSSWVDETDLRPGATYDDALVRAIKETRCTAVLIGEHGKGPWQQEEVRAALRHAVTNQVPVIPVLLPGAARNALDSSFLGNRSAIDMSGGVTPAGIEKLVWGITGARPAPPGARPRRRAPIWMLAIAGGAFVAAIVTVLLLRDRDGGNGPSPGRYRCSVAERDPFARCEVRQLSTGLYVELADAQDGVGQIRHSYAGMIAPSTDQPCFRASLALTYSDGTAPADEPSDHGTIDMCWTADGEWQGTWRYPAGFDPASERFAMRPR